MKNKKGFTFVEMIAIMAIMAIATALVLPNIQGMIDKKDESKIKNYCVEATTNVKGYTNLLLVGNTQVAYQKANGEMDYYKIKDNPEGLQNALNEYNLNVAFQYYVLPFVVEEDKSSSTTDPSASVKAAINDRKLAKKDVMVTCIEKTTSSTNTRTEIYKLIGFWFYSYSKGEVVYSYYVTDKRGTQGFMKLTKDGK